MGMHRIKTDVEKDINYGDHINSLKYSFATMCCPFLREHFKH